VPLGCFKVFKGINLGEFISVLHVKVSPQGYLHHKENQNIDHRFQFAKAKLLVSKRKERIAPLS